MSNPPSAPTPITYRDAGVDIDAGDALVERIKPFAKRTMRPEVLAGIGGFGALVEIGKRYREPVLVAGTDGVGTKLKLAFALQRHDTIGIDLVAMSANDILVQGAEPLFFLDYYACGKLDVDVAARVERRDEGVIEAAESHDRQSYSSPCSTALAARVTAKIAPAGASVHGNCDNSLTSAASRSIVPQVGSVSGKPSPR